MKKRKVIQSRLISNHEIEILKHLWKWKMSNTLTLRQKISPANSFWKFYKRIRNLSNEGYIIQIQDPWLKLTVWTLTKKGFKFLFSGSTELEQNRFQIQSTNHDFWCVAFQMGNFVFGLPKNVELISEQEVNAKKFESLPQWIPQTKKHIPDGYTRVVSDFGNSILAFEIETSTKTIQRYEEIIHFLDQQTDITLVLWLCENDKLIELITKQIVSIQRKSKTKHNFVRLSEFQKHGWGCKIVWGNKAKMTVSEMMGQLMGNTQANLASTLGQLNIVDIFTSNLKSPKGLKT